MTPSASESGTLWVSGPPTQGRSGALALVTNMSIESLPAGAHERTRTASFGPYRCPVETAISCGSRWSPRWTSRALMSWRRSTACVRLVWSADGSLVVTGSPGTAHPGAEIQVKLADSQQEILATADEVGGFRVAVVASAGEVLQIRQGTSAGGVLTWSAPTRKRAPQTGLAYPKDQLRTRWQSGELSVSGIGCDIPGASGVTVSIVGLGGDAIPAGAGEQRRAGRDRRLRGRRPWRHGGDRAVVRVVLGGQQSEPALLTVPSPGTHSGR